MRAGQAVTIYEDPLTEMAPEGKAKLVRLVDSFGYLEGWMVEFAEEPGTTYFRSVRAIKGKNASRKPRQLAGKKSPKRG